MKKTILTIATILAVSALSLTACGGEASNASPKTENSAKTQNTNAYKFYKEASKIITIPYKISDKSKKFLKDHGALFPCQADEFATENNGENVNLIDTGLQAKHFMKNKNEYGDKLMMVPRLTVIQIEEDKSDNDDGYITFINAGDENDGQYYLIIYNGRLDLYEGDEFSCIGLPLDTSSYENTSNETVFTIVMAGSVIDKLDDTDSASYSSDTETYLPDDFNVAQETYASAPETYAEPDTPAPTQAPFVDPNKDFDDKMLKSDPNWLGGVWNLSYEGGGNGIYIKYDEDNDLFMVSFSGSCYDSAGETTGFLSAYTDGTDGLWQYYANDGGFTPVFLIKIEGNKLTVSPDQGYSTFGGMAFPGFDGTYTRR